MVMTLINRLLKLDFKGAFQVKYFGIPIGVLLVALIVAYRSDFMNARKRLQGLVGVPILGQIMTFGLDRKGGNNI